MTLHDRWHSFKHRFLNIEKIGNHSENMTADQRASITGLVYEANFVVNAIIGATASFLK